MKFNWFENASPGANILLTFALMVVIAIILSLIAVVVAIPIFGKGLSGILAASTDFNNPSNLNLIRYMQVVQSIALFVVPPILLSYLFGSTPKAYLKMDRIPVYSLWTLTALILIAFLPFINLTESLNSHLKLPDAFSSLEQSMRNAEESAKKITELFLNVNTYTALAFNIFMMALIPAIGEELVFRGVLQRLCTEMTKNAHWGIIISAAIFSAIHFQFYGFIPRMLLGMLFGYLFVWSGSIIIPIFAHFLNNALGVIYFFMEHNDQIDNRLESFGSNVETTTALISFVITVGFLYIFKKRASIEMQ